MQIAEPRAPMLLPNRIRWGGRVNSPSTLTAPLGFGTEYWRPWRELPGLADLQKLAGKLGRNLDPRYELTQYLLYDVIDAGTAVEYAVARIAEAVAEAEVYVPPSDEGPEPEYGRGLSHPALMVAYIEFGNLLVWMRALDDRVERKDLGERFGLLPAIAADSPLAKRVKSLRDGYRSRLADDASHLANFTLHASRIPHPLASDARIVNGKLALRIPDKTVGRVASWLEFRYDEGRSVETFASDALGEVVVLVDGILDAFEAEAPARLRRQASE